MVSSLRAHARKLLCSFDGVLHSLQTQHLLPMPNSHLLS